MRGKRHEGVLSGVEEWGGDAGFGVEGLLRFSSSLRLACLPGQQLDIFNGNTSRASSNVVLVGSARRDGGARRGTSELGLSIAGLIPL